MALTVRLSPALVAIVLLGSTSGGRAIDLGVSVGGIDVGVSVGGDRGVGVDVGVGNGGGSLGLEVDLDGDGVPETRTNGVSIQTLGQEGALRAVRSSRALPLEDILLRARLVADGEIIDARLIEVNRILVYEIKVLGKRGDVRRHYFYARSGALVTPR